MPHRLSIAREQTVFHLLGVNIMKNRFSKFAVFCSHWMGSSYAFAVGTAIIVAWALTGPIFHFSDTWQLVINTGTTIVTFLMVFVIQYTQNRDTQAIQLKLDELLRAVTEARNALIGVEDKTDDQLENIKKDFQSIVDRAEPAGLRKP
jgi:low affinity Fe/Cu permease